MEITFYRKLANKVADAVISNQQYSEAEIKKIRYGLVCIFSDLYKTILFLLIFSIFSLTKEFVLAFLAIMLLRPFLGGYHAKSEVACIFMSFSMLVLSIFLGKQNLIPSYILIGLLAALPILGALIAPVQIKEKKKGSLGTKLAVVIITIALMSVDYFVFSSQIITLSVLEVYILAVYQQLINKLKYKL
ncbi:MAG TPA: accessory gene regulator B family protein [Ruminiclostridium sp.]|nr:accessory gene regulator B family protein [Ruminiclostridium sp.]